MDYGTVVSAVIPPLGQRFNSPKHRSLVIVDKWHGFPVAVPTSHSRATRIHLVPNEGNGLWKPVGLITNIRYRLIDPSRFERIGHLTAGELVAMRKLLRNLAVAQTYTLN